jgi:ADP-dependent NAD(P)H-hydrate dehydratase / NAD(P)H-hydrate epimerase
MDGLLPVLGCAEMAAAERAWLRRHPGEDWALMRRAAAAVADEARRALGATPRTVLVLAGKGRNGADAVLAGLLLAPRGTTLTIALAEAGVSPGLPARALGLARRRKGTRVLPWKEALRGTPGADLILDGILGSGFQPPLSPGLASLFRAARRLVGMKVAVDVPSGVGDATDGPCLAADLTVSLGCLKRPLLRPRVAARAGRLRVADLGLGLPVGDEAAASRGVLAPLAAPRDARTEKRRQGRVLIVGGSPGMPGAVVMNTRACLQAGAGLVSVVAPAALQARAALELPEAMWMAQGARGTARRAADLAADCEVTLLGSGLGTSGLGLARAVARAIRGVAVLDADALRPAVVRAAGKAGARVLLPHAGELLRLGAKAATPAEAARLARRYRALVVLKGPLTCVTDGARTVHLPHGGPILARGGSGDLLAGMVAAVVAARAALGLDLPGAVVVAATWHGAAADAVAASKGETPVRTTQLLDGLLPALRRCRASASVGA